MIKGLKEGSDSLQAFFNYLQEDRLMKKRIIGLFLAIVMAVSLLPQITLAAPDADTDDLYVRTIMMYDCGSNLETYGGMATYNLKQILSSNFSKDDKVKFIIMTALAEWASCLLMN